MSNSKQRQREHIKEFYAKRAAKRRAASEASKPKSLASDRTKSGAKDRRFNSDVRKHGKGAGRPRNALMIAGILEFGKHNQAANPFITRGFEVAKDEALNVLISSIKEALEF